MSSLALRTTTGLELLRQLEAIGAVTETSLTIDRELSFDEYESLGAMFGRIKRMTSWLIGDWIIYGAATYGEKYAQAVEETGLSRETLRNYAWVCEHVAPSRRLAGVSFSVHSTVASMSPKDQRRWLGIARRENLTQRDLRQRIRDEEDLLGAQQGDAAEAASHPNLDRQAGRSESSPRDTRHGHSEDATTLSGLPLNYVVPGPVVRRLVAEAVPGRDGYVRVPRSLIERLAYVLD